MRLHLVLPAFALLPMALATASPSDRPPLDDVRAAIAEGAPRYNRGDVEGCAAVYEAAARALVRRPEPEVGPLARADLARALEAPADDADARAWALRRAMDRFVLDEEFQPTVEAALPAGFPAPGPVGRVVVKEYPRYRAARAQGGAAFWTLFRHIKKNEVEMTAPVEMTVDSDLRETDMAFLYESPEQGQAGQDGAVAVLDLPSRTVLSIGMRGDAGRAVLEDARAAIEAKAKAEGWEADGPWRRLGYNSPMIPAARRFWELQLPVRRAVAAPAPAEGS